MLSRVLAALTAATLLSFTAACGSDGDSSEATSAKGGERPAYADNAGEAGAQQFIGFWTDTLNEATTSGETRELRALATDDCEACADFAGELDKIYGAGGHVESKGWTVDKMVPEAGATDDKVGLMVTFDVAPQTVYPTKDAEPQEFQGGKQGFRFSLVRAEGDWAVKDLSPR